MVLGSIFMVCYHSYYKHYTITLLFFAGIFSGMYKITAGGMISISGLESQHEPVYLLCAQDKKVALPYNIACLSKLVNDQLYAQAHAHMSSIKLDLSESRARKLVMLVQYAYALSRQELISDRTKTAYQQITFEDIAQLAKYVTQLQFPDTFTAFYAELFAQRFFDATLLTRCAEDREYAQKLLTLVPEEYIYPMLDKLLVQRGYLLWGALHAVVGMGIDEADTSKAKACHAGAEHTSTMKAITKVLAKRQSIMEDSRAVLCCKLVQQEHILILVTSDRQSVYLELYDVKSEVLLAQMNAIDMSSQESTYWLDIAPDMLKITLTTFCPEANKARLLLGYYGDSQEIKAIVQTFDISCAAKLLSCKELFFLLICEYAAIHNKSIDQAYIAYFLNDPCSFMHEAILRYKTSPYSNAPKRCSIS